MKLAFTVYSWLAPAVLAPLSFWLWHGEYQGNLQLVAIVWGLPVLWAYVVPGIGTNVLKVWEFDTRFRLGRFRIQHGFVFGSATSMIAWLVHGNLVADFAGTLRTAFVLASVLGFWNLLYDIKALEAGVLRVYNQPWAEGRPASAVALDYAPWFFAGFGAVYGAVIGLVEWHAAAIRSWPVTAGVLAAALAAACAVPTAGYMWRSMRLHGHPGTRPVKPVASLERN